MKTLKIMFMKNLLLLCTLALALNACKKSTSTSNTAPAAVLTLQKAGTATLSTGASNGTAASIGTKLFFANGYSMDIYDASTNKMTVSPVNLSSGRFDFTAVAANNQILFVGGASSSGSVPQKTVDVYDASKTPPVITSNLSLSTGRLAPAGASAGNHVVFAGGYNAGASNTVDIYDLTTKTFIANTHTLSVGRYALSAAAAGTKIVFAGGYTANAPYRQKVMDIYDVKTGQWDPSKELSIARSQLTATASGNLLFFAGGFTNTGVSTRVDIYNVATETWEPVQELSVARRNLASAAIGDYVVFGGGYAANDTPSAVVDIYNVKTKKWTTSTLSVARGFLVAAAGGNKLLFAGGNGVILNSNVVDIFELK